MRTPESTKWTPESALEVADRFMKDLAIPAIGKEVTKEYDLDFTELMNATNVELEQYLVMFGGYRAYLENQVADTTAVKTALDASFNESFSTAIYKLAEERENAGLKKLTRDELRGAALLKYDRLKRLRQDVITQEAIHIRLSGLLNAYKATYDAVSRIVTLRNLGREQTRSSY